MVGAFRVTPAELQAIRAGVGRPVLVAIGFGVIAWRFVKWPAAIFVAIPAISYAVTWWRTLFW
jgi:hypothetical protein